MRGRMGGMRFRKLRIAWSVGWAIACVLLIVLWVRSYRGMDSGRVTFFVRTISFNSSNGRLALESLWGDGSVSISGNSILRERLKQKWMYEDSRGFVLFKPNAILLILPHWFLMLLFPTLATAPWVGRLKWRFSLRTLLIATTLVAVVLGLAVWGAR
jgi:hypothetical protein